MHDETKSTVPTCVGFIMDGNRRWAQAHGLSAAEGHARGYETFCAIVEVVRASRIPHMVCYAFSTENWKRTEEEVGYLMNLLEHAVRQMHESIVRDGKKIQFRVIGERSKLPQKLITEIERIEQLPVENPELTLWMALSYGGRAEIVAAAQKACAAGVTLTEETLSSFLWTQGMPDPDLIIRTSGEIRISNFLLWQSAYSELFFTKTLWPDFGETEFQSILEEYGKRSRRKGA